MKTQKQTEGVVFKNFIDAQKGLLRKTLKDGINIGDNEYKEVFGFSYRVINPSLPIELVKLRNEMSIELLEEEFQNRINKATVEPSILWKTWSNLYKKKFTYTYHDRINDQLDSLIERLKNNAATRRALLLFWRETDLSTKNEVPCETFVQYGIKNEELIGIHFTRSQDLFNFYYIDIFLARKLQEWLSAQLDVIPGVFLHNIGSMHIYTEDIPSARIFLSKLSK